MLRGSILLGALLSLSVVSASAQITLNSSFLSELLGSTLTQVTYSMNAQDFASLSTIIAASGGNQTYDFTPYTYDQGTQITYPVFGSATGTGGENDPDFVGANYVSSQDYGDGSAFWSYYNLTDAGYDYIGSYYTAAGGTQVNKNVPPDRIYAFPLSAGSSWDQTIVTNTVSFGFESSLTITEHNEVDGWGMLVTPAGSAPCLRLRKTRTLETAGKTATTIDTYFFMTSGSLAASIASNSDVGGIVVATYGVAGGTGTAVEDVPTRDFDLLQNYPNPFSSSTTIAFELDVPSRVDLRVFDVTGREVATVISGVLSTGMHHADLSGDGLMNGVYFYRLEIGERVITRSLIHQK